MSNARLQVQLEFDTDSLEFARGFEAGANWAWIKAGWPMPSLWRAGNRTMVERIAAAIGMKVTISDHSEGWIWVETERLGGKEANQ